MLSSLSPERRTVVAQLARFVISGAFVTALGIGVYAIVALILRWHPQLGNFLAYRRRRRDRLCDAQPLELPRSWRRAHPRDQDRASSSSR